MLSPGSTELSETFASLAREARAAFASERIKPILKRSVDLRYQGQGYELRVDWSANLVTRFHQLHAQSYGYSDPSRNVEIVTVRVHAIARSSKPRVLRARLGASDARHALVSSHRIFEQGRWRKATLYDRTRLRAGNRVTGPAVITELSATTYLPTSWTAFVDTFNNLILVPRV